MSLAVNADLDDSDEDLRLYVEESEDESWKDPPGESKDLVERACGLLWRKGLVLPRSCFWDVRGDPNLLRLSSAGRLCPRKAVGLADAIYGVLGSKKSKSWSSAFSDMSKSRMNGDEYGSVAGIAFECRA
jgi:hypothetical protein